MAPPILCSMAGADLDPRRDDVPRCPVCGEVIGVYERVVQVVDGRPRLTSRAAEPYLCGAGTVCYHRGCYPLPVVEPVG